LGGSAKRSRSRVSTRWQFWRRTSPSARNGDASAKRRHPSGACCDPARKPGHSPGASSNAASWHRYFWYRPDGTRLKLDESGDSRQQHPALHHRSEHFKCSGDQPQRFSMRDFAGHERHYRVFEFWVVGAWIVRCRFVQLRFVALYFGKQRRELGRSFAQRYAVPADGFAQRQQSEVRSVRKLEKA
jgi:hypothetical protein